MTLRTRVLLGYGYLVLLLLVGVAGAALAFHQLGRSIDRLLRDNFASVQAAMAMLGALEEQDSATLETLLGNDPAHVALEQADSDFLRHLERAAANLTEQDEDRIIAAIGARFTAYSEARDGLLAERPAQPLEAYEQRVLPAFRSVKTAVEELLGVNERGMAEADRKARRFATAASLALGALAAVAVFSLASLARGLQRNLLDRLEAMKNAAEDIAGGNHRRRVRAAGTDELAVVGRQLNAALDRQAELESRTQGRFNQSRLILLALLARWPEPVALVGLDGTLVASTLDDDCTTLVVVGEDAILKAGREQLSRASDPASIAFDLGIGEALLHITALAAEGSRPAGWLVSVTLPGEDDSGATSG